MSLRACWQTSLALTLLVFLAGGCERRSPTGTEAEPTARMAIQSAQADVTRPFKGRVGFSNTIDLPTTAECTLRHQADHKGEATHLGRFSGTGTTCGFNLHVVAQDPPLEAGDPPYLVADYTDEATWTAASGDDILLTVRAIIVLSLVDGTSATRGTMVIHGGTRRFAEATGEALVNRNADEEAVSFEGWINYD